MSDDPITDVIDPAKDHHIRVPPALIDAVQNDPEVLARLSRAQLTMIQDKLTRQYLQNPDALVSQGVAIAEVIRKTAKLEPKETGPGGGSGFSITINIPQVGHSAGQVIEAKAAPAVDVEDAEELA